MLPASLAGAIIARVLFHAEPPAWLDPAELALLLARLAPVVGAGQALLVTSATFGIGHWFGHPSGASGVLMAGFAGYM